MTVVTLKAVGARVAVLIAAAALLGSATTAASPTQTTNPWSDFHCTASSQTPGGGGETGSGRLLPGKPGALALCRYGRGPSQALEGSRLVTRPKRVHRLVRRFNALPSPPAGPISCPNDDGSSLVAYALYRRAATRIIHVGLSGCLIVSRGDVVRWDAPSGGKLVRTLEDLTR